MFNLTRRQALAASGGLLGTLLAPSRFASAAVGSTLNIAYNVNLPSFDPQTGPSSVNPTIQAIYRSIFDQISAKSRTSRSSPACSPAGAGTTTRARFGWRCAKASFGMTVRR